MQELETKIAAWRKRMSAALPGRDETVRELEEHLRDHIEMKMKSGSSPVDAFAHAVTRMGETQEVARAFRQLEARWTAAMWSIAIIYGLMAIPLVVMAVGLFLENGRHSYFEVVQHFIRIAGYLAVFGTGLLGLSVLVGLAWNAQLGEGQRGALQRAFFRFAVVASGFVPASIVLGLWSEVGHFGSVGSWPSLEIGALAVGVSSGLLLAVQFRTAMSKRLRGLLAALGCVDRKSVV